MIVRYVQPLTTEQRDLLENAMKNDPSFRARSRAHSLLLSAQGTTSKDIAKTSKRLFEKSSWVHEKVSM